MAVGQLRRITELVGPCRRGEMLGVFGFPELQQQGIPHGAIIRRHRGDTFAELRAAFPSAADDGTGDGCQDAVAGGVDEKFGVHRVLDLAGQLPGVDRGQAAFLHPASVAGGVQEQGQIRAERRLPVEDAVPDGINQPRVALVVVEIDFLEKPGFGDIRAAILLRPDDPHPHLRAGVAAQYRPVVDQHRLRPAARRGHGGAKTGQSAADHADIRVMLLRFETLQLLFHVVNGLCHKSPCGLNSPTGKKRIYFNSKSSTGEPWAGASP